MYKIDRLDHYGRGLTNIDGKTVFVDNALIGEEVEITIITEKKNYSEAKVKKYINTSPLRVTPKCPYYDFCGGCDIMHLPYEEQLKFKNNKIKEIVNKFTNLNIPINNTLPTLEYNYRNKVTLQVDKIIGYYSKKSNNIIKIDNCIIADLKINNLIDRLNKIDLSNINQVVIRVSDKESMLVFYAEKKINSKFLIKKFNDITSLIVSYNNQYEVINGKPYIVETIDEYSYIISPQSFFQVNKEGMIKLYNQIIDYCSFKGNEKVLDLYCGTGTIGIYISKYCKEVLGIEINKQAIKDANENKKINNVTNISFACGDVDKVLKNTNFKPDIIIVDPPRAGLETTVIDQLLSLKSNKIVYVSCDPITLARDLKLLNDKYAILEITPVDMFSQTHHVESVCILEQKN